MSDLVPRLAVRVSPGASRDGLGGVWEGPGGDRRLIIRVSAAPEKGKANKAVIALLSKALGVPKSALSVVSGETDRNKLLAVEAEGAGRAIAALWAEAEAL